MTKQSISAQWMLVANRSRLFMSRRLTNSDFQEAKRVMQEAERIYMLGFGFGAKNVERLGIKSLEANKCIASTVVLTALEQREIQASCEDKVQFGNGDCTTFM